MKRGTIEICDGCSVGFNAIVLYDTCLQRNAVLDDLSLIMKNETM